MVMLKLNHINYLTTLKCCVFFIVNSDHSQTYWNGYAYTLARFPSDCVKQIYCFYLLFYSLLSLLSTALQQLCCGSCWWRCSRPYVHVWWVGNVTGVSKWCSLDVIQALKTNFQSARPVIKSSTAWAELFTLLQCYSTTPLEQSTIAPTPLRSVIHPSIWMGDQNETNNAINLHVSNTENN